MDHATNSFNGEWMSVAREARGLSQTELARRLDVTQGYVSRVEAGLTSPTGQFVDSLVRELDFPAEFFMQHGRVYGASISELYHRKRAATPARALGQIHAWLNIIRMQMERMIRAAEDVVVNVPRLDIDLFPRVEDVARAVRAQWQLPPGPVRDLVGVLEDAGIIVYRMNFPTRLVDAISWWIPPLPPIIFVNRDIPADRENWSDAHEVGHLVLHHVGGARPDMEHEADAFAAEFLMPAEDIAPELEDLTLERLQFLKKRWRVSMSSILRRAKELGTISPDRYRKMTIRMSAMGFRTREPLESDFAKSEASFVRDLVDMHVKDLGFGEEQLARHLRVHADDMQALYGSNQRGLRVVK